MSAEMNKKLKDNNIIIARRELEMGEGRMGGGGAGQGTPDVPHVVSPEKTTKLDVGTVMMPNGTYVNLSQRSKSKLSLKTTTSNKKIALSPNLSARHTLSEQAKVRSLAILTSTIYYTTFY